MQWTLPDKYRL